MDDSARHVTDDERRARLVAPPRDSTRPPRRRRGGGHPGGGGAPRHRAGHRPPRRGGPHRRRVGGRRRPGALRRPRAGQAARDAPDPLRLPAGPAAGRLGERLRPGRRDRAQADRRQRGGRRRWPTTATRGSPPGGSEVLDLLAADGALGAQQLRERLPALDVKVAVSPRLASGAAPIPIAPRVLGWLGARAEIVRGVNGGHWRISRPRWTPMADWLGESRRPAARGRRLRRAGRPLAGPLRPRHRDRPRLVAGLRPRPPYAVRWPTSGRSRSRSTPVTSAGCCPTTSTPRSRREPSAALLPTLDPTTMGWKQRGFYLDPDDVPYLFDTVGNGGTTAWWDGPDRRLLGPGRRRAGSSVVLRGDPGRRGAPGARRRGRAAHRLAGRRRSSAASTSRS